MKLKRGAVGLLALAFLCAAHAAVHTSHIACLLGQWTLGHALHLSLGGVHGLNSANNTVDLVLVVLTRHTDQVVAQLAYWPLGSAGTDAHLMDREATGELIDAALRLRHGRLQTVLVAFCNKGHAGVADNAVNDVLLAAHRNALPDLPCHTNG